jgi:ribose 5-phosphate isomerase B
MKKFDIITEVEARVLAHGETVMVARGGHVTPLARDTLSDRRITVVTEGVASPEEIRLTPTPDVRTVAIGSDHTGRVLRRTLVEFVRSLGLTVWDVGIDGEASVDYPDVAAAVSIPVARGEVDAGIVIDGAGIGSAIGANKIPGIRAAMAVNETIARYSREHNGANVLTLGAILVTPEEARGIVRTWLATPMVEPRYIRRLAKIRELEQRDWS